jgi:hypothetical protein
VNPLATDRYAEPYAAGGEATVENIQLRCRAHNAYEAELYYGTGGLFGGEGVVRERPAATRPGTSSEASGTRLRNEHSSDQRLPLVPCSG